MRGVLSLPLWLASLMTLAGVLVFTQARADEKDDLLAKIAATGPLPCDQQAVELVNLQFDKMEADLLLAGIGKSYALGDTWVAGNTFYDQARTIMAAALDEDQFKNGAFFSYTPTVLISKGLSGLSVDDLRYLEQFFSKPEGKLYWEENMDGTICAAWLKKFGQAPYPPLDGATAERWQKTTAGFKGAQERFVKRFNALPKATQAAYYDGKDKIGPSVQQAPLKLINERNHELGQRLNNVLSSKMDQLQPIIDGFKAAKG
ncbi:MAG: hypothetical protein JO002_11430 [Burkholderiaceae bacterium]|nr:hypothetical protein [Burkholderiaceae bacterium]